MRVQSRRRWGLTRKLVRLATCCHALGCYKADEGSKVEYPSVGKQPIKILTQVRPGDSNGTSVRPGTPGAITVGIARGRQLARYMGYARCSFHMIRISFLYPNSKDARFDLDYYVEKHMPWSIDLLSVHPGFRGVSVERGISAGPGADAPFVAICNFLFEKLDDFMEAVAPHLAALRADMRNYTDIEPTFQVSEVLIDR